MFLEQNERAHAAQKYSPEQLITILKSLGIEYLAGRGAVSEQETLENEGSLSATEIPTLELIQDLASSEVPRIRDACIVLFLLHPEFADDASEAWKTSPAQIARQIATLILATLYLQRLWASRLAVLSIQSENFPEEPFEKIWTDWDLPAPAEQFGMTGLYLLEGREQEAQNTRAHFIHDWQNQIAHLIQQEQGRRENEQELELATVDTQSTLQKESSMQPIQDEILLPDIHKTDQTPSPAPIKARPVPEVSHPSDTQKSDPALSAVSVESSKTSLPGETQATSDQTSNQSEDEEEQSDPATTDPRLPAVSASMVARQKGQRTGMFSDIPFSETPTASETHAPTTRAVTQADIEQFLVELGKAYRKRARIYLTGSSALIHLGLRPGATLTIDVLPDAPDDDEMIAAIRQTAERQQVDVQFTSPEDFVPIPAQWKTQARHIIRYGTIEAFYFDFYSLALSKVARGSDRDLYDLRLLIEQNIINLKKLEEAYREVLPRMGKRPYLNIVPQHFSEFYEWVLQRFADL